MEATIVNFRLGRHTQKPNHMILLPAGISVKEKAADLIGKKVVWKSPAGKELIGKIASTHGSKGAVRAIFETGMPGQSIGQKVVIE